MTQEEKQLLLKDLCGRLPYGVQTHIDFNENGHIVGDATLNTITSITGQFFNFTDFEQDFKNGDCCPISGFGSHKLLHLEDFKPYLRPMSSMTEKELKELNDKYGNIAYFFIQEPPYYYGLQAQHADIGSIEISEFSEIYDWLNEHYFDYRGLIEKDLAIKAPEEMYKI